MSKTVISVENLSKKYDLGVIGTGTIRRDLNRWWSQVRGKGDPYAQIGEIDHSNRQGKSILALNDVSFTVEQGEVLGIIGGNGAGKSTLLKILSQVTAPTDGIVKVRGRIGSLLEVGTGFHPELTGRENIYLNGAILGMSRDEVDTKFDEIVDFSGVEKFIDTPVKRYSSGMYVRLGFAVAAHLNLEILIVDEVLAVGDAEFQKKCLGKMGDVAHEGRTVLFVSHNMGSIRKLCNRGVLLYSGQIIMDSDVEKTIDSYLVNGSSELTPVIDLPEKAHNVLGDHYGSGIRLSFFSLDGNKPKAEFRLMEKWRIRLEFEVFIPLQHAIAAVGLSTTQGSPLVTYWSEPGALQPGKYEVEFICDIPLTACGLTLEVDLSEYENSFYHLQNLGLLNINDISLYEQPFKTSGAGIFLDNSKVIIKVSP